MALARDRILEAAHRVVSDLGAGHLTLEAVALAAGVSKGGLLYHFPTKEALIAAVANDYATRTNLTVERVPTDPHFSADIADAIESHINRLLIGDSRVPAANLGAALLLAASEMNSLRVVREGLAKQGRLLEGSAANFAEAAVILLAIEGLMLREAVRISAFTETERDRVVDELLRRARNLTTRAEPARTTIQ